MAKLKALRDRLPQLPNRLAVQSFGSWRNSGMTANDRGYTYRWQQARAAYLRLHPLCVMCEAEGRYVSATVVDHIEPHRGNQTRFWDASNWQGLCTRHHATAKQRQEKDGG